MIAAHAPCHASYALDACSGETHERQSSRHTSNHRSKNMVTAACMNPGTLIQLNRDVDVFPTILCKKGHIGIIASMDSERIMIRMFNYFSELNEWNNELEIWREWNDDALTVLTPVS